MREGIVVRHSGGYWRRGIFGGAALAIVLFAAGAQAQSLVPQNTATDSATVTIGEPQLRGTVPGSDTQPLSDAELAALRAALAGEPSPSQAPAKPLRRFGATSPGLDWKRDERPDGSAQVKLKKPLATEWDTSIGADLGLAATAPPITTPEQTLQRKIDGAVANASNAAWANVAVPGIAALDARVDPTQDQGALGATFKQALPLGSDYALTLQNRYGVVDEFSGAQPLPGSPAPGRVWTTDRLIKLDMLASRTAIAAGTTSNTADNVTRGKISAEQKLYGPLSVTTAVSDIGAPVTNKSITAGFKLTW